ncbi:hypothetical protein PIB30_019913 [Stylosanthes scabra]|uniref:Uncharacterized protein n=1 Tax=Stylosanthes scabra TaxID=79078 RepID=A0ABU6VAR3_9FABA|nr:hypothetical protein [Stylosanthes scabra]
MAPAKRRRVVCRRREERDEVKERERATRREGETQRGRGKRELSSSPPPLRAATTAEPSSVGAVLRRRCWRTDKERGRATRRGGRRVTSVLSSSSPPPLLPEAAVPEEATVPSYGSRPTTATVVIEPLRHHRPVLLDGNGGCCRHWSCYFVALFLDLFQFEFAKPVFGFNTSCISVSRGLVEASMNLEGAHTLLSYKQIMI